MKFARSQNVSLDVDQLKSQALNHHKSGEFSEAETIYQNILSINPDDSNIHSLLGSLHGQTQNYPEAIKYLEKCIELAPDNIDAYNNLALAYELSGHLKEAACILQKALSLCPNHALLHNNIGDLYRQLLQFDEALHHFSEALAYSPENDDFIVNKALTLCDMGLYDEAQNSLMHALSKNPYNPKTLNNTSAVLMKKKEYEQAEMYARKALQFRPVYPQALNNLGNCLLHLNQFQESETLIKKAISINPSFIDAHRNLGYLYHELGKFDDAITAYNKAIQLNPNSDDSYWYRSFTYFTMGNFEAGWQDYEHGLTNGERSHAEYSYPVIESLNDLSGQLLVYAEQGIGDQIMFSSLIPELLRQTKNIVLECDARLEPLFKRAFSEIPVFQKNQLLDDESSRNDIDISHKIAMGSLANFLNIPADKYQHDVPYLIPDESKKQKWLERLDALGKGKKIGISWKGGVAVDHEKRSLALEDLLPVLSVANCQFINLQYGEVEEERTAFHSQHNIEIHDWDDSDSLIDLDDFAAKISALDLVISVGNTNVHLAGSLGTPAWCLLPYVPSWRWMFKGKSALWYPSVEIFRQPALGDWQSTIQNTRDQLFKLTK